MEIYEDIVVADFTVAGRTTDFQSIDYRALGCNGISILVDVVTAGAGTLKLRILGREPFEGNYSQMNVDVTLQGTGNRSQVVMALGVAKQPPGEVASTLGANVLQVVSLPPTDVFALAFVKGGDASNWKWGAIMRRIA